MYNKGVGEEKSKPVRGCWGMTASGLLPVCLDHQSPPLRPFSSHLYRGRRRRRHRPLPRVLVSFIRRRRAARRLGRDGIRITARPLPPPPSSSSSSSASLFRIYRRRVWAAAAAACARLLLFGVRAPIAVQYTGIPCIYI